MGDKIAAKATVAASGVPVVPGIARPGLTDDELVAAADDVGYPGAGQAVGRRRRQGHAGRRTTPPSCPPRSPAPAARRRRRSATTRCSSSASCCNPGTSRCRCSADAHGNVVHLGERECSLQRRHQKVIEEAPSPLLDAATRARIGARGVSTPRAASATPARAPSSSSSSADRPDEFFFMEMNTRCRSSTRSPRWSPARPRRTAGAVAAGEQLPIAQDDIALTGTRSRPGSTPRIPRAGSCPTGGTVLDARSSRRPRRAGRSGLCAGHRRRQRLRPDAGQGHRARRRPRRGAARAGPRAGRHRRARGGDERRRSCASCSPTPTSSPAGWTPG